MFLNFEDNILVAGLLTLLPLSVAAQVTPDGTTSTTVDGNGNNFTIEQGDRAGSNLFHSFRDFSVSNGGSAFFNNDADIANIFSRVTGGNISNIDGLLRANDANLFLINPAGIIFGAGARLDLGGGSFYGSTADSILFEDGEFNATDLDNPPLLTINAPIGLSFRDNPEDIEVTGSNLAVNNGQNLALIGGEVTLNEANINAPGGRVELGGSAGDTVTFSNNGSLNFEEISDRNNISLGNNSIINVTGQGDGAIAIYGKNVELTGESIFAAGIAADFSDSEVQAGDIVVDASESIVLDADSIIRNNVNTNSQGNAGNIILNADRDITIRDRAKLITAIQENAIGNTGDIELTSTNLVLNDNAEFRSRANTNSQGNAGKIIINAEESFTIANNSRIFNEVKEEAVGNAGEITINTKILNANNNSNIESKTFGEGNAGSLMINATDEVVIDNNTFLQVQSDSLAQGDGGNIEIETGVLSLKNGSGLLADTKNQGDAGSIIVRASEEISLDRNSRIVSSVQKNAVGNAGDIELNTVNLSLSDKSRIEAEISGTGNAGNINVNAEKSLALDNSNITNQIDVEGTGKAGNLEINTRFLSLANFSLLLADTKGQGDAGNITINASEKISLTGTSDIVSGVGLGLVENPATGNGGNIVINTKTLELSSGSSLFSATDGLGDAGNIIISAAENVLLSGTDENNTAEKLSQPTQINLQVRKNGEGKGGNLEINTANLSLINGSRIDAGTAGNGEAGAITLNVTENIAIDGEDILERNSFIRNRVGEKGIGNAGIIDINTANLSLTNGGRIIASTSGRGNGGAIIINTSENLFQDGENSSGLNSSIVNRVDSTAIGNAGSIEINTANLSLINGGRIDASTFGRGNAGAININATENISIDGEGKQRRLTSGIINRVQGESSGGEGIGNAGTIDITTPTLSLTNGGRIDATTFGTGNAGEITVNATENIFIEGKSPQRKLVSGIINRVDTDGTGDAGDINVMTPNLSINTGGEIGVSALGEGNGGNIFVKADSINLDGGNIVATIQRENSIFTNSDLIGGNITLEISDRLVLRNNGLISAMAGNNANGGNIDIDADFIIAFPSQNDGSDILANAQQGRGGNIDITTEGIFNIESREPNPLTNDINASSEVDGLDGVVTITTPDVNPLQGATELPSDVVEPEQTVAQVCRSDRTTGKVSGLTVRGKGGVPPNPTEPMNSDAILVEGEINNLHPQAQSIDIKAIATDEGDIYPARGVIVTESGEVILTAYPTDVIDNRTPDLKANCSGV